MEILTRNIIKFLFPNKVNNEFDNVECSILYKYVLKHQVDAFVMHDLINSEDIVLSKEFIKNWKSVYMYQVLMQKKKQSIIKDIVLTLNEANINHVFLKGIICANYYENSDYRPIGDIDILISQDDRSRAKKVLRAIGYKENESGGYYYDDLLEHKDGLPLELHFRLDAGDLFKNNGYIEKHMLEEDNHIDYKGMKVSAPLVQTHITYLLFHAVKHITEYGFGLRQLLDIHLMVEEEYNNIDWKQLIDNTRKIDLEDVSKFLLILTHELFGTEIPNELKLNINSEEIKTYDQLKYYLLEETYMTGASADRRYIDNTYAKYCQNSKKNVKRIRLPIMGVVFPKAKLMPVRYRYVIKYPVLLPVGWVHRIIYEVIYENQRAKNLLKSKPDKYYIDNHINLLKNLNLGSK